ncbi:MAG: septum formation inhibitor Maf [Chitinophagaceae bacterium]|nr:septum formation inhibitor Maf [Oligoflexus sp.]
MSLILASTSPRRKELLSYLGLPFAIVSPHTEEKHRPGESGVDYAKRNSMEKAEAVYSSRSDTRAPVIAIGADTIGLLDGQVLEKPLDTDDAVCMLTQMSGRSHQVITAVSLVGDAGDGKVHRESFAVETLVFFKQLSPAEISYYVQTKEPMDKAGSYGIQGIGGFLVRSIQGSYSNVVGLPLVELSDALKRWPSVP